jgi:ankyrin repeat protein
MLHVNSLKGKINAKAIEDALTEIRSGGNSLVGAYDKTMRMIESQVKGHRKLAMHTLAWVAISSAPLTVEELQHALAIELGKISLNFDNITKFEIVLSTCAGLITIQKEYWERRKTVHLVHETTQYYLLETREKHFGNVRTRLARLSLTYLTFQTFEAGHCESKASRKERYPLYAYLGRHFSHYMKGNDEDAKVKPMLEKFFLGDGYVAALMQTLSWADMYSIGWNALHLAIFYRLGSWMPLLIHKAVDGHDGHGQPPIHLAVRINYFDGVEYLLSAPEVDCNATDMWKRTALSYACEEGEKLSVRLLLACDRIDCNIADTLDRTPLIFALERCQLAIVQLLLERKDVDYRSPDFHGSTPMHHAAMSNSEACMKELLSKPNPGINMVDSLGRTPLVRCIQNRCLETVLLLLARQDVDLDFPGTTGWDLLYVALELGHPHLMELFLTKIGSRIHSRDKNNRTALDHLAEYGNWQAVEQISERHKTTIRVECDFKDTALYHALRRGPPNVVKLLFSQISLDKSWWLLSALTASMENESLEGFVILTKGLLGWMQCHPEWVYACVSRAAEVGTDSILVSVLQHLKSDSGEMEAENIHFLDGRIVWDDIAITEMVSDIPSKQLNIRDRLGQTALHAVVRRHDIAGTRILLIMGSDIEAKDSEGATAFQCASEWPEYLDRFKERLRPILSIEARPSDRAWHVLSHSECSGPHDNSLKEHLSVPGGLE